MNSGKKSMVAVTLSALMLSAVFTGVSQASSPEAVNDNTSANANVSEGAYQLSGAVQMHPAREMVEEATNNLITALKNDAALLQQNPAHIYPLMEQNILMHFDFQAISKFVLGRTWRKATQDQRDRFTEEFRRKVVGRYADAMLGFSDETIVFKSVRAAPQAKKVKVETEIQRTGSSNVDVDYTLYQNKKGDWKIYDITIEGVSMLMTYRSELSSAVRNMGGIDPLIDKIAEINDAAELPVPTPAPTPAPAP